MAVRGMRLVDLLKKDNVKTTRRTSTSKKTTPKSRKKQTPPTPSSGQKGEWSLPLANGRHKRFHWGQFICLHMTVAAYSQG